MSAFFQKKLRALAALPLAALLACAGAGVGSDQLPSDPLALVLREEDDEKRLEQHAKRWLEERSENIERPAVLQSELARTRERVEAALEEEKRRALYSRVVFLDPQTRELTRVEFASRGSRPLEWSPDRSRLLFASERQRRTQLFEWSRESGEVRQLTFGEAHLDGCYGPEGRLAVVRHTPLAEVAGRLVGGLRIWITEPGGRRPHPVSDGPIDRAPAWSPKGDVLAFERSGDRGVPSIHWLDPRQPGEARLLLRGRSPVFHPSGDWLIYSGRTRSGWKLLRAHPDGGGRRPLGKGSSQEFDPAISRDGRFVAFTGVLLGETRLYVRTFDGDSERQLYFDGTGTAPAW